MSEVQRYSPIGDGVAKTDINGMLVAYEDYMIISTRKEQLKAEVERLRKAGDELLHEWSSGDETDGRNFKKGLVLWNAAKEGKQS